MRVSGVVDKVYVKEGDTVKKGLPLFEIDARAARLNLEQARASLAQAEARAKLAAATLDRLKRLLSNNVVSREEYDQSQADAAVAAATLQVGADRCRAGPTPT